MSVRSLSKPFRLGLTGSIGMGKSTTAAMFAARGIPVHDADAAVHALYAPGGAGASAIARFLPDTLASDGSVDRKRVGQAILGRPDRLSMLETAIHPLVREARRDFVEHHRASDLVVFDVPLLFETGTDVECDSVLVVTASEDIQRSRVLARPGMTEDAFQTMMARQMPDAEKRRRADFIIDTGRGHPFADAEVDAIVARLRP